MRGEPEATWSLDYSSVSAWLQELLRVPATPYKRIARALPLLDNRIADLIEPPFSSSSDEENDHDDSLSKKEKIAEGKKTSGAIKVTPRRPQRDAQLSLDVTWILTEPKVHIPPSSLVSSLIAP
jgi:hypothetical protein